MISNESYLKPQPLAESVYNSLHWTIQKIFKTIKICNQYSKNIIDLVRKIFQQKRIFLMKVPKVLK